MSRAWAPTSMTLFLVTFLFVFGWNITPIADLILIVSIVVSAVAYVATNVDSTLKPFDWYQAHVVEGAVEHGLPAEYIAGLRAVEVTTSA